jgi:hypothetical protein
VIAALLCLALTVITFGAAWGLYTAGLRVGDRVGDTTLTAIEPEADGRGIWLTVHNPGHQAVLLGASVRRRSLRLWCEAGCFVSVPRCTLREKLLAGQHALVCAIDAGATQTVRVPLSAATRRRVELVVAIGEAARLRVVHRAVELPGPSRAPKPRLGHETQAPSGGGTRTPCSPASARPAQW